MKDSLGLVDKTHKPGSLVDEPIAWGHSMIVIVVERAARMLVGSLRTLAMLGQRPQPIRERTAPSIDDARWIVVEQDRVGEYLFGHQK